MVNFNKLKSLINEYEKQNDKEKSCFFKRLHDIAEIEMNITQLGLNKFFGG